MPEISRFFGIVIYMNWREHPPMHFHAVYAEYEALITFDGAVYAGSLPRAGRCRWCANGWRCIGWNSKPTGNWRSGKSPSTRSNR